MSLFHKTFCNLRFDHFYLCSENLSLNKTLLTFVTLYSPSRINSFPFLIYFISSFLEPETANVAIKNVVSYQIMHFLHGIFITRTQIKRQTRAEQRTKTNSNIQNLVILKFYKKIKKKNYLNSEKKYFF